MSISEDLLYVQGVLKRARETRRWSQSELAERVGWIPSKISKLESGRQVVTLHDLLVLEEVMETGLLASLIERRRGHGVARPGGAPLDQTNIRSRSDAMKLQPPLAIVEAIHPDNPDDPLFPLDSTVFAFGDVVRIVDGAQVPRRCVGALTDDDAELLQSGRTWLTKVLRSFRLQKRRLDGLCLRPALGKGEVETLRRPTPTSKGPVAPRLETRVRGSSMETRSPRVVVDPVSLDVTVVLEPLLVLRPLIVIFPQVPNLASEEDTTGDLGREQQAFRLAGLLASDWVQSWMARSNRLWFKRGSGPYRDVPVPGLLWDFVNEDGPGQKLENLARDIWQRDESDPGAMSKKWAQLNGVVDGVMEKLWGRR